MSGQHDEANLRAQLAEQYQQLESIGLNELSSGNVSCRFGDNMLISPSGATGSNIAPEHVVEVTLDGEWSGERKPSSEWRMHAAIYKETKAQAVVHTHSDHCVALACQGRGLPGFHYLVGSFGGSDVPCVPYSTFGTEKLAQDAAAALHKRSAPLATKQQALSFEALNSLTERGTGNVELFCQFTFWREFFTGAQRPLKD